MSEEHRTLQEKNLNISNTTGHVRIKKGEIVEFHVVITSRDNAAVLSSLINIVIVPLLPLLSSFSCCIIECENSVLFCLQGQNWETSGSWRMNNILGQAMLFYIFPFFFLFWPHHWANVTQRSRGFTAEAWRHPPLFLLSWELSWFIVIPWLLGSKDRYTLFTLWEGGEGVATTLFVSWVQMWPHMTKINSIKASPNSPFIL